jgi:hypothetical protein
MAKKLTLLFLLLLAVAGVKAQIYCYHCYKEVTVTKDGRQEMLPWFTPYNKFFTFQGDLLFEYPLYGKAGKKDKMAWKYDGMRDKGNLLYFLYYRSFFGQYDDPVEYADKNRYDICYVSDDRNWICICKDACIYSYYQRCPDWNCR